MIRVVVAVEGEVTTRAAQSLGSHPGVEVAVLDTGQPSPFPKVESPAGYDAVVGSESAVGLARSAGLPAIVTGDLDGVPGVAWASIPGLALALSAGLGASPLVAVAVPGEPVGDDPVVFPSPIDARPSRIENVGGRQVHVARGHGDLAAALALGPDRHRVIIDHHLFMEGIALAAGIALVGSSRPVAVWEEPGDYLRTAAEMGLVIGERAA